LTAGEYASASCSQRCVGSIMWRGLVLSVAAKKGTKMAAKWSPARGAVRSEPFPLLGSCCPERPGAVKGAPLLGAAKRTLDGEDRSEMIAEEGKAGANDWRKVVRHFGTLARRL